MRSCCFHGLCSAAYVATGMTLAAKRRWRPCLKRATLARRLRAFANLAALVGVAAFLPCFWSVSVALRFPSAAFRVHAHLA